jgi:hypothetical protein
MNAQVGAIRRPAGTIRKTRGFSRSPKDKMPLVESS